MRFFGHTFVAVAVVASLMLPTRAALMTDAEETAKAAGLDVQTSFFKQYWQVFAAGTYKDLAAQCKAVSTAYAPFKSGDTACDSSKTCSTSTDTACCKKEWQHSDKEKAEGCNEAPEDWRKANNGKDEEPSSENCCDVCIEAAPTDTATDAYKYYQDKCVAPFTNVGARFAVCNEYKTGDDEKMVCGAPIEFSTDSVTNGEVDLEQEEEEEDGEKTGELKPCEMLQSDWDAIFAMFKDSAKMNSVLTKATLAALSPADNEIFNKISNGMGVIFMAGPVIAGSKDPAATGSKENGGAGFTAAEITSFKSAKITVSGTGSKCVMAMNQPTLNADLDMSTQTAYVAGATVFVGNTITFGGDSSATVVDSTNAATIIATASGAVNIHKVVNTGDLTATGLTGAFLSSVKNSGKVTLNNVEGNAIFIDNAAAGTVEIKGTSNIAVKFCNQKGKVTIADTVTGTVAVPKGHVKPTVPTGVTLTEVADTGCPAFGDAAAAPATPDTPWSEWTKCTCDDPADLTRTRTFGGAVKVDAKPCQLDKACPGVEGAEPAQVEMVLVGDGLWDWVNDNLEKFKTAMTTDIAATLFVSEDKISDVKATLAASLLLKAAPSRLLAEQSVDVSFIIASGASNTLTPVQLAKAYERAVNNGTANFSSTEASGCPTFKADVTGTGEATVIGQGTSGMIILAAIALFGLCFIVALACLIKKMCFPAKAPPVVDQQTKAGM